MSANFNIPYTFTSILSPVFAVIFAATGIGVWKNNSEKKLEAEESM